MIHHRVESRSEDWFLLRLGRPTASEFFRIVTPGGKISSQAESYAYTLLAEMWLAHPLDNPATAYMQRGTDLEDQAIDAYEFQRGCETQLGGFVTVDDGSYGCSPDRLVGDEGILEMKVPAPNTHVGYLLEPNSMEFEKKPQIMGQMLVCEREWVDLVSFHPEMPMVIHRVKRDEPYIHKLRVALATFCEQLQLMRERLELAHGPFPPIVKRVELPALTDDPLGFDVTAEDVAEMIATGASVPTENK